MSSWTRCLFREDCRFAMAKSGMSLADVDSHQHYFLLLAAFRAALLRRLMIGASYLWCHTNRYEP